MLLAEGDRLVLARDFAAGLRVLPAGQGPQPELARARRACQPAALRRGERRAARAATASAGCGCSASCWRGSGTIPACSISSPRPTRAGSTRAIELGQFAKGRKILHDLEEMAPDHPVVRDVRERFIALAARAGQGGARPPAGPRGSMRSSTPCGSGPTLEGAERRYAQGLRRRAHARRGRQRRALAARPLAPLAGRRAGEPAALPADPGGRQRRGAAGQASPASSPRRSRPADLGRRLMSASARASPGRTAPAGHGGRRRPRLDRSVRSELAEVPGALGRPARPGRVARRDPRRDPAEAAAAPARRLVRPARSARRTRGDRRPGRDRRAGARARQRRPVPLPVLVRAGDRAASRRGSRPAPRPSPPLRVRRIREFRYSRPGPSVGALIRGEVSLAAHVPPDQRRGPLGQSRDQGRPVHASPRST